MDIASIGGLMLRKRADIVDTPVHYKVINVTKMIRRTKSTKATTSAPLDELEFGANSVRGKLVTKTSTDKSTETSSSSVSPTRKSKIAEAIDQVEKNVVKESQTASNKKDKTEEKSPSQAVSESINAGINEVVTAVNDEDGVISEDNRLSTKI